jgi:aspartyl protease family protein
MIVRLLLAFLFVAGLLLLFRDGIAFLSDMSTFEILLVAGGVVLIGVYVVAMLRGEASRPMQAARYFLIWCVIGLVLVTGYSYRDELSGVATRVAGELLPPGQTVALQTEGGHSAVRVRKRLDGHYAVRATVNGEPMMLLVDTGASTVVLKPSDAERAGINLGKLAYTVAVHTANGTTYAAPARLHSIAVGPIIMENIEALVARPGSINENLLGMSFLRRLQSYEFSKDYLTLKG